MTAQASSFTSFSSISLLLFLPSFLLFKIYFDFKSLENKSSSPEMVIHSSLRNVGKDSQEV